MHNFTLTFLRDSVEVNLTFDQSSVIFSEASGGGQVCVQVLGDMFARSVPVMVSFEDGSAVGELSLLIDAICLHLFC